MSSFFFRFSGVILIFILLCSNNFLYPFAFLSTAKGKTIVSVFSVFPGELLSKIKQAFKQMIKNKNRTNAQGLSWPELIPGTLVILVADEISL
jgi:ABC-type uncharacterized transport system substrate-binding protein